MLTRTEVKGIKLPEEQQIRKRTRKKSGTTSLRLRPLSVKPEESQNGFERGDTKMSSPGSKLT